MPEEIIEGVMNQTAVVGDKNYIFHKISIFITEFLSNVFGVEMHPWIAPLLFLVMIVGAFMFMLNKFENIVRLGLTMIMIMLGIIIGVLIVYSVFFTSASNMALNMTNISQ